MSIRCSCGEFEIIHVFPSSTQGKRDERPPPIYCTESRREGTLQGNLYVLGESSAFVAHESEFPAFLHPQPCNPLHVFLQCNHRSWADFMVDQYVTEGRSLFMSRLAVVLVFPLFMTAIRAIRAVILFKRGSVSDKDVSKSVFIMMKP